jgi:hypothetical protein
MPGAQSQCAGSNAITFARSCTDERYRACIFIILERCMKMSCVHEQIAWSNTDLLRLLRCRWSLLSSSSTRDPAWLPRASGVSSRSHVRRWERALSAALARPQNYPRILTVQLERVYCSSA